MPLQPVTVPESVERKIVEALVAPAFPVEPAAPPDAFSLSIAPRTSLESALAAMPARADESFAAEGASRLDHAAPHAVYHLDLDDLTGDSVRANGLLRAARRVGLSTLIVRGDATVLAAHVPDPESLLYKTVVGAVDQDASDGDLDATQLFRGPFLQTFENALQAAEALSTVATNDYEPRILEIPTLYLSFLWLHRIGTGRAWRTSDDLLLPLPPVDPPLEAYEALRETELRLYLRAEAFRQRDSAFVVPDPLPDDRPDEDRRLGPPPTP